MLLVIANAGNVFAYIFQFIMGRSLSIDGFATLTALNSFAVIITMFYGVMPYLLTKYILKASSSEEASEVFSQFFRFTLFSILAISSLLLFFREPIQSSWNINSNLSIYLMILFIITSVLLNLMLGVFQSEGRYLAFGLAGSLLQLLKLSLGVIFVVVINYSYNGALFAAFISNLILIIVVYSQIKSSFPILSRVSLRPAFDFKKNAITDSIPVGLTLFLFAFSVNIDMVLIKYFINSVDAGKYAAASVLSKIAIFLPSVLISVLFPQVIKEEVQGKDSNKTFRIIFIATMVIVGLFCFFVELFSSELITLLFGDRYKDGAPFLLAISIVMGILASLNVIFNFLLAKQQYGFLYLSYGIVFITGLCIWFVFNTSVTEIVNSLLFGALVLLASNFIYYLKFNWKKK